MQRFGGLKTIAAPKKQHIEYNDHKTAVIDSKTKIPHTFYTSIVVKTIFC